tara:strand:+ start:456 stop:713 length:258 start_codon:yes stop_codon:yes gene_type:complete
VNHVDYVKYRKDLEHDFKKASDQELIDRFNGQVRNSGWCHAKMIYLYCLQKEMIKRFDTSNLIVDGNCSYANYILLRNKKVLFIL